MFLATRPDRWRSFLSTLMTPEVAYGAMTPLQRMADPAEVAAVAAFLASSDSSFMTGSEVAVDGGLAQV